jgi:GNAT superfamily N-acetyltransferase
MKIRKATKKDMKNLDKIKGEKLPKLHNSRFALQKEGKAIYFIAFEKDNPLGHVLIVLDGNEKYHTCPILQDLFITQSKRKEGKGRLLLEKIESKIKDIGYRKIGLDVETKEKWLKRFYKREGYKIIGKTHQQIWIQKDSGKKMATRVWHMEKILK